MPFSTSSEFFVALVLLSVELVGASSSGAGAICLHGAQQQSSNPISCLGQRTITRWSSGQPETSVQRVTVSPSTCPREDRESWRREIIGNNGWTGDRNRFEIDRTVFRTACQPVSVSSRSSPVFKDGSAPVHYCCVTCTNCVLNVYKTPEFLNLN